MHVKQCNVRELPFPNKVPTTHSTLTSELGRGSNSKSTHSLLVWLIAADYKEQHSFINANCILESMWIHNECSHFNVISYLLEFIEK